MRIEDYPPQEPLSEAGERYAEEVMRRADGIEAVDHAYGDDPYQTIGLHLPENPNGTVLAFVHGGGWISGYKEHMNFMAPAFTSQGIIFASIGYRLAPKYLFPTGAEDVAAGIAWLYDNISDHGGDPSSIFVGGHSAGGHYTALLAVRHDWQADLGLPTSVIRGVLPISGVYKFGEGSGLSSRPQFLGDGRLDDAASPLSNLHQTPPFLIAHGGEDFPHLSVQAVEMETALKKMGGEVERLELPGRNHFSACYAGGEADGPWVPKALSWLASH